jgi:hypothetical protein
VGNTCATAGCSGSSSEGSISLATTLSDFYCRDANLVIECDGGVHDRNGAMASRS